MKREQRSAGRAAVVLVALGAMFWAAGAFGGLLTVTSPSEYWGAPLAIPGALAPSGVPGGTAEPDDPVAQPNATVIINPPTPCGIWAEPISIGAADCVDVYLSGFVTQKNTFRYANSQLGMATFKAACLAGFDGGAWTGPGITSSAAAADANKLTAVGYVDNSRFGPGTRMYDSWRGIDLLTTPGDQALVSYTYYGDANLDGAVDGADLALVQAAIATPPAAPKWQDGDFNYDGQVSAADLTLFWRSFNAHVAPMKYDPDYVFTPVPEPGTTALLVVGGLCLAALGVRRRACSSRSELGGE